MNIDDHILKILDTTGGRAVTIGDLARQLGISPNVIVPAARRLVDDGRAGPSFATVHGVPTLRGLVPSSAPRPGAE